MAPNEPALLEHLEFLYGTDAVGVLDELLRLMRSYEGRISPRPAGRLTEKDSVLITYGDMVREPGRAPLASLGEFLQEHIRDVISTVHILPFYPHSSDDGFAVIDYLQVDPALGDWDDLSKMRRSFRLMFDAVLNHISAGSKWFEGFLAGDERHADFFTVVEADADISTVFRPRDLPLLTEVSTVAGPRHVWTTFSADQVDLNYANPAVLLAAVDVLLTYVVKGADVIRLDAIAFIWKELGTSCIHLPETHRIIQLFRSVLDVVAPSVLLVTETNVPHRENVSYFGDGSNEADLVYNFALPPLTLHAFHNGDATVLSHWAEGMEAPSETTSFFNFLASHDGIGLGGARGYLETSEIEDMADKVRELGGNVSYRALPDGGRLAYELNINYLDALGEALADDVLTARRFLTSQALMLSLQGLPGIYFHSLFGSRGWPEGVAAGGALRTINRQKLERAEIDEDLADAGSLRSIVLSGYRRLLEARSSHAAFAPASPQQVYRFHDNVFAVLRTGDKGQVLCLHNVSGEPVSLDISEVAQDSVRDLIDGARYGPLVELDAYQTVWLAGEMT